MCGLVALIKQKQITVNDLAFSYQALQKMKHRGPDDQDLYYKDHLILGFNRLSIIDLKQGVQPFHRDDYNCHLVFNGEIYNYQELRNQLEKLGFSFDTQCEAEVILCLYHLLGKEFITQLRGMFSLVLYDERTEELIAVRDRFGIKPLYYYVEDDVLFLTSELKPFKQSTIPEASLDFIALQHYFTFQYIPEPLTCLKDVKVLEPGTYLTYQRNKGIEIKAYNTIQLIPHHQISSLHKHQLETVIKESVRAHLQSDVEVGCFLSGGVDSTIITACANQYHPKIKAFTIGFHEAGYSEIEAARETADFLNIPLY
ncbi:asparagine synthase (glutamine-hydrolyzing), partial [Turicibacter sanguinis]|nr:asparagine synthase (glutamine-hydrolyzing) [Turicibacter sanguinis]